MNRRLVVLCVLAALGAAGAGAASATPPEPQGRCIKVGVPMAGGGPVGEPHRLCLPGGIGG